MSAIILAATLMRLVFDVNPTHPGGMRGALCRDTTYCVEPAFIDRGPECLVTAMVWRRWMPDAYPCFLKAEGKASHDTLYVRALSWIELERDDSGLHVVARDVTWWLCRYRQAIDRRTP